MTFIPRQQEKHCFIACSEDKVNAGLCDCINRMRNEALRQPLVICRATFKGIVTNDEYNSVMKYITDMQSRGWVWLVSYTEGRDENLYIDYVLEKHGI